MMIMKNFKMESPAKVPFCSFVQCSTFKV